MLVIEKSYIPAAYRFDPARRTSMPSILVIDPLSSDARSATVIGTVYTMTGLLMEFFSKVSTNQTKKLKEVNQTSHRLLRRVSKRLTDTEIGRIQLKLEMLCLSPEFQFQPSWGVYVSFCLAILNDEYDRIKNTKLADFKDDVLGLIQKLYAIHKYMEKKDGTEHTEDNIAKGAGLHKAWERML